MSEVAGEGTQVPKDDYSQALAAERAGDFGKAVRLLKRGAWAKETASLRKLGDDYRLGRCGKPNWVKALFYLRQAAEQKDAEALNGLGELYERWGDANAAIDCYYRAAHMGQAAAMAHLGDHVRAEAGRSVHHRISHDEPPALAWVEKACQKKEQLGLYLMGVDREWQALKATTEKGWRADMQAAYEIYQAAAREGSPLAMAELLWPGAYSDGCVVSLRTISPWVVKKAGRTCYPKWGERKEGHSLSETAEKYLAAARAGAWGEETAWYALGRALWAGTTPIGQDMEKAVTFLEKAAERGSSLAMSALKDVYADAEYAGADEAKAAYWLERQRRAEACAQHLLAWREKKAARAADVLSGYPYDEVVAASATAYEDEYE